MKVEQMTVQMAIEQGKNLPLALVRSLSGVTFGETPQKIPSDILEARFFDTTAEIHIFTVDGTLVAVKKTAEESDRGAAARFEIKNPKFGRAFTVFQLYAADEDGQSYIKDIRLTGWEGGTENG